MGTHDTRRGAALHDPSADRDSICPVHLESPESCACVDCKVCGHSGVPECGRAHGHNIDLTALFGHRRELMRQISAMQEKVRDMEDAILAVAGVNLKRLTVLPSGEKFFPRSAVIHELVHEGKGYLQVNVYGAPAKSDGSRNFSRKHDSRQVVMYNVRTWERE